MINVICFFWRGNDRPGWTEKQVGELYVNKLYRGVARNLSLPFTFFCFSDCYDLNLDKGIIKKALITPSRMGCLPKLVAYNPAHEFKGRVVMMDIDLVVTGNLDEMFSYDGYFMTRSTFIGKRQSGGDIAFFEAGTLDWMWDLLKRRTAWLEKWTGGRERFVYRHYMHDTMDFVQDLYPGQLLSYKRNIRHIKRLPKGTRIVSCHGKPRPHEIEDEWIKEHWI